MLVEEESVEIEKIISHRIIGDVLEYRVKFQGYDQEEWVSSNYFEFYTCPLLEEYNKEIDTKVSSNNANEIDSEIIVKTERTTNEMPVDAMKMLALNFTHQFNIKMEYAWEELENDDAIDVSSEHPIFEDVQFGAAEVAFIENEARTQSHLDVEIKGEMLEPSTEVDITMESVNDVTVPSRPNNVQIVQDPTIVNVSSIVSENNKDLLKNAEDDDNCNKDDSIKDNIGKDKDVNDKSISDNVTSKKNITIGKLKKASKPVLETKSMDEKKTVKSLLLPSQISATPDEMDLIFYNLPVVTKVVPAAATVTESILAPLTLDIFVNIVNSNNLMLLNKYSRGSYKSAIEQYLIKHHYILVTAVHRNLISMISALLELGANVNGHDSQNMSSLMVACDSENEAIIDLLINNGASINRMVDGRNELLARCIRNNKLVSFKFLLNVGIDFYSIETLITDPQSSFAKILEEHKKNLLLYIEESILVQMGRNVKVNKLVYAPRVLSLFEVQDNQLEVSFLSNISPIIENHCNLLFLITGLIHGSSMKCLISDANRISSVALNGIKQQSLTEGQFVSITSFNPVQEDLNKVVITFDNEKCRKIRLILVAFNVIISE